MKTSASKLRWLAEQLPEWEKQGLISPDNAVRLRGLYQASAGPGDRSWAQVLLGCIGSLLIAAGVILVLAHNWEELARPVRALIAFGCLLGGHAAVVWTLWRRPGSAVWRESSAVFLGLGVAACISLIAQTYHIPGDLGSFLLVWTVLLLPLPYLLRSGFGFLLGQTTLTAWALHATPSAATTLIYGGLFALSLPYLWRMTGTRQGLLLRWVMAIALCFALGAVAPRDFAGSWILLYGFFFSLLVHLSPVTTVWGYGWRRNPFAAVGDLGLFGLAALLTFSNLWPGGFGRSFVQPEGYGALALIAAFAVASIGLLIGRRPARALLYARGAGAWAILLAYFIAVQGDRTTAALLMTLFVLTLAAAQMRQGYREMRLALFNVGFLELSILVLLRFFDSEYGILPKAAVFIVLGVVFLTINSAMSHRLRARSDVPALDEPADESAPLLGHLYDVGAQAGSRFNRLATRPVAIAVLAAVVVAQLIVPANMMVNRELTLRRGTSFRFETAPVDPYDPFRGRYVALAFKANEATADETAEEQLHGPAFARIDTDERGYARLVSLSAERPAERDYLQVRVYRKSEGVYHVTLPFDRYYMNEHTAPEAERLYLAETRQTVPDGAPAPESYALIRVRAGTGVIAGLYLDGQPIEERIRAAR